MASAAAVPRSADLLDVHFPVVSVQEEGEDEGDEESYGVDDAKHPRGIEHAAVLLEVIRVRQARFTSRIAKNGQGSIETGSFKVVAVVCVVDAAEVVDTGNKCTHEAEVDECDEEC